MPQRVYVIAAGILVDEERILLIQQQGPHDPAPTWALPGGVVEQGELLTEALVRELQEETGLAVARVGPLAYATQLVDRGAGVLSLAYIFEVREWSGTLTIADPDQCILADRFVPFAEAEQLLQALPCPVMREPLVAYLRGEAARGSTWLYRQSPEGEQLIEQL